MDFTDTMKEFAAKFAAKYDGKMPESWSAYYYDKVYMIKDVIEKAGSFERADIVEHIHEADVPSVVYPQGDQFDEKGRLEHPVMFIYRLEDDLQYHVVSVWESEPPHKTMDPAEYQKWIDLLQNK